MILFSPYKNGPTWAVGLTRKRWWIGRVCPSQDSCELPVRKAWGSLPRARMTANEAVEWVVKKKSHEFVETDDPAFAGMQLGEPVRVMWERGKELLSWQDEGYIVHLKADTIYRKSEQVEGIPEWWARAMRMAQKSLR